MTQNEQDTKKQGFERRKEHRRQAEKERAKLMKAYREEMRSREKI